jgi:hypothetical protein
MTSLELSSLLGTGRIIIFETSVQGRKFHLPAVYSFGS